MSRELAESLGFQIGEKVLYPHYHPYTICMDIITVKDVRALWEDGGEIVMGIEEFDGYINPSSVYTKEQILAMFNK